jgi:hypothetical protein
MISSTEVVQSHQCTYRISIYEVRSFLRDASTEMWRDFA